MLHSPCPIVPITPDAPMGAHYFFGYYDKSPWNSDESRLLAHRVPFLDRFPTSDDGATVGLIDPRARDFHPLADTRAWNWQQGAQLQWLPDPEGILYNDRRDGRLVGVLLNPGGSEEAVLDHPVYTVAPGGRVALTLNYGRLTALRPEYGYPGLTDPNASDAAPRNDGVVRLDLASGGADLLVSIAELAAYQPSPLGAGGECRHYVNHLMFNPSGTRFCFLHRFQRADGIMHSRLFTLGTDGSGLRLLMEGMISHYHWRDDRTILAWAGRRKLLGAGGGTPRGGGSRPSVATLLRRTLKPVYYALGKPRFLMSRILGDSYLLITDAEDPTTEPFAKGELTTDGHCTYSADRRWVLTDGYPDLKSRQPLFLWDTERNQGHEIGRYPTPRGLDGPLRVDLHPRLSHDSTRVCIDSAMDGRRRMYLVDVSALTFPARPPAEPSP